MRRSAALCVFLMAIIAVQICYSQKDEPRTREGIPIWIQRINDQRQKQTDQVNQINKNTVDLTGPRGSGGMPRRGNAEIYQSLEEINELLVAPPAYYEKYADFLKGKNTGIARLVPDKGCGQGRVVNVAELERCRETPQIKGAGSIYSLRLYEIPGKYPVALIPGLVAQSDLHFIDGKLVTGTEVIQDIIGKIDEGDLANITLKSKGVKFVRSFKPVKKAADFKQQQETLAKGVESDGFTYSSSVPIKLNDVYILRSIAYYPSPAAYYPGRTHFWNTDLIAAIKVVGQDADGSIVILWKKLKQSDAPILYGK